MTDTTSAAQSLLPCPFCGHDTPEFERLGTSSQSCIVACGNCGARHESGDEYLASGTSWNCRVPQPAPAAHGGALTQAARDVLAEVERATRKFPTWPTDPLHALAVLGEEFGELTKDMLQLTYEPHKTSTENVRTEAMQTAAMALRLFMSLERYEYKACEQHSQAKEGGA